MTKMEVTGGGHWWTPQRDSGRREEDVGSESTMPPSAQPLDGTLSLDKCLRGSFGSNGVCGHCRKYRSSHTSDVDGRIIVFHRAIPYWLPHGVGGGYCVGNMITYMYMRREWSDPLVSSDITQDLEVVSVANAMKHLVLLLRTGWKPSLRHLSLWAVPAAVLFLDNLPKCSGYKHVL